jgi:hypothetical protein
VVTGARTSPSTTWSTAARAFPCLRAAGGDWSKDIDYMVDYRPRDSLSFSNDLKHQLELVFSLINHK